MDAKLIRDLPHAVEPRPACGFDLRQITCIFAGFRRKSIGRSAYLQA
jgi:hypothetical protein